MECTQRLECTQDLYDSPIEKTCPEQIGFLGICGTKYPVKRGPNKIGRDPQTCSIVLQLESISRQHAVINILNQTEHMLMDLDSANKTKLSGKSLQPYIPHPLHDGDLVQFGKVFGVFRLLADDTDLPQTQALDTQPDTPRHPAPDTPRVPRHPALATLVPESPEVSDRDDSFIAPSQPKLQKQFQDDTSHFIKPSSKTITIQPIGSKKIDNVYWNSSKRSTSIGSTFDDSTKSLNDSTISLNKSTDRNLQEMETQAPTENVHNVSAQSIFTADTQMPNECNQNTNALYNANTQITNKGKLNESLDSIYTADTQLPSGISGNAAGSIHTADTQAPNACNASPSIHNANTQMPAPDNLPRVCKVPNQHEMQFDFCLANKENDNNLFNAETQAFLPNIPTKSESLSRAVKNSIAIKENSKSGLGSPDDLFQDIDNDCLQFQSQSLLDEPPKKVNLIDTDIEEDSDFQITLSKSVKRTARIKSDSSTDCEDFEIAPTQQLPVKPDDDDLTDCEDAFNDSFKKPINVSKENDKVEEMLTQVLVHEEPLETNKNIVKCNTDKLPPETPFEDMLTQVIEDDEPSNAMKTNNLNFEDMPTQVICYEKEVPETVNFEDQPTQVLFQNDRALLKVSNKKSDEFISPFKVPLLSPRKAKRKDTTKSNQTQVTPIKDKLKNAADIEKDDNYYDCTQDIVDELCTQPQFSDEITSIRREDDDIVPSSVEDFKGGDVKLPGLDYDVSPKSSDSNLEEKLTQFVSSLSKEQVCDVIGVQSLRRQPSDPSDTEATPKKVHPMKLFEMDLPDSQEIKRSVSIHYRRSVTESSSESETENDTEEQCTPILYRKKKKPKIVAKLDLTKRLDVDALPSRVSTRVRKPAVKLQESDIKKRNDNLLKPKYLTEQEGDISNEIIIENITRLKTKNDGKNEKNKSVAEGSDGNKKSKSDSKVVNKSVNKTEVNATDTKNVDEIKKENQKGKRKSDDKKRDKPPAAAPGVGPAPDAEAVTIDLTNEITTRTRSSRNKQKDSGKSKEKKAGPAEKADKKEKREDVKRHKSSKREEKREDSKEVRRSRRQKSYKEKKENDSLIKVKITKPAKRPAAALEASAVYDSPPSKRRAPSPRAQPAPAPAPAPAPRARPRRPLPPQKVLFTAFPFEEVKNKLQSLGAEIVSDVTQCTVLVTLHIKRTFKLLCAVGLGRPVVGKEWVQACSDLHRIVDPWQYLLQDSAAEQRFGFSLPRTLRSPRGFLRGCSVSCTPSVRPALEEMILIVECSGGTWGTGGPRWLCVSCAADRAAWPGLAAAGATVVSSELVLGGVLRQKLDVEAALLYPKP